MLSLNSVGIWENLSVQDLQKRTFLCELSLSFEVFSNYPFPTVLNLKEKIYERQLVKIWKNKKIYDFTIRF